VKEPNVQPGFLTTGLKGRGFSLAIAAASRLFPVSRPAQVAAAICTGRGTNSVGIAILAGLKPALPAIPKAPFMVRNAG